MKRCIIPRPTGPSRNTVSGTIAQPKRFRDLARRDLAVAQRAARKVPERALAPLRLVDREQLVVVDREAHEKGGVRRPRHPAEHFDVTFAQHDARGIVGDGLDLGPTRPVALAHARVQFIRGQMCPSGSIGKSHSGHLGRPAVTATTPLANIARICARVA